MKLTNTLGLPEPLFLAAKNDTHISAGDISCSQLIDSPKIRILKKQFPDVEYDLSETLFAMLGTGLHAVLEKAGFSDAEAVHFNRVNELLKAKLNEMVLEGNEAGAKSVRAVMDFNQKYLDKFYPDVEKRYIFEKTLTLPVSDNILSGTFDLYDKETFTLYDYKMCSVWAYIYPESRNKWVAQTNIYAHMLRKAGHKVNKIQIVAMFRDWSAATSMKSSEYPKTNIVTIDVDVKKDDYVAKYIHDRMNLHIQAENGNIPDCTGQDRWATADKWAIIPHGNVKAKRVFDVEADADVYIKDNGYRYEKGLIKEYRPGENKRCDRYCQVRSVCPQLAAINEKKQRLLVPTENPFE